MNTLRILTLNILNNPTNILSRYKRLQEEIIKINPDVVLFQESLTKYRNDLSVLMESVGFGYTFGSSNPNVVREEDRHGGNVVYSKYPFLTAEVIYFCDKAPSTIVVDVEYPSGVVFTVVNNHLKYLTYNEGYRLGQVNKIDAFLENRQTKFTLMCGDFNATPTSPTISFLKGLRPGENGVYTYWVDAHELYSSVPEHTTGPELYWARVTASQTGILYPEFLPNRRIDYIFAKGWSYGSAGHPVNCVRFAAGGVGEDSVTDHYGLYSDILIS